MRAALWCAAAPRVSSELARFENWGSKGRKGVASLLALCSTLHCFVAMAPREITTALASWGEVIGSDAGKAEGKVRLLNKDRRSSTDRDI